MKKFSMCLLFILLLIPMICCADVAGSYSRSSIAISVPVPEYGAHPSFNVVAKSSGLAISNVRWFDVTGRALTSNDTFGAGSYKVLLDITRTGGDSFRKTMSIYVNDSTQNVVKADDTFTSNFVSISWSCTVEAPANQQSSGRLSNVSGKGQYMETPAPIKEISFVFEKPAYGKNPVSSSDVTWNKDYDTALEITDLYWVSESTKQKLTTSDTFGEGAYIVHLFFKLKYDYTLADDYKITFNGYSAVSKKQDDGSYECYMRSTVTKPAETTTDNSANSNKKEIIEAIIESGAISEIKPIETLPIESKPIELKPIEKLPEESKLTPIVTSSGENKTESKSGDEKPAEQEKVEEKPAEQEKAEEKSNGVTLGKVSDWAEEELKKANDMELIPSLFEKEDLTKNITRKEFAHVAVKLYEKVSGQKAVKSATNPFSDVKDDEVLKAYNVGITNGTSDTTFEPNALITREQMATMMTRALAKAGKDTSVNLNKVTKFADDGELHAWGQASVYYMSNIGIIKGIGDNKFGVTGNATREQALLISERSAEKFSK